MKQDDICSCFIDHYDDDSSPSSQQWMISFADLLSLILTFFVLIYAMSSLDKIRWEKISYSLSQKLNPNILQDYTDPAVERNITKIDSINLVDLNYLSSVIVDKIRDSKARSFFNIRYIGSRLIISLTGEHIFTPDSVELTEEGRKTLLLLGEIVQHIGNHIDIYADAYSSEVSDFQSAWEISINRAVVASQLLRKSGYEYRIASFGRVTENNRKAPKENRENLLRVDIVIRSQAAEK